MRFLLLTLLALAACPRDRECAFTDDCAADEICLVDAAGPRCVIPSWTRAALAGTAPTSATTTARFTLTQASVTPLAPSSRGGPFTLRPLASANEPPRSP